MQHVGKSKTPVFLQCLHWVFNPVGYLEKNERQHPDLFVGRGIGFGAEIVITSHPQVMQSILTNDRKQFTAPGDTNQILEPLIGSSSTVMLEGESHKKRRQLMMPAFHGDRLRTYGESIMRLTRKVVDPLAVNETFTARAITQAISLQIIFEVVFGLDAGETAEKIRKLLTATADRFNSPLASALLFFPRLQKDWGTWSPWGQFLHLRRQLDALLYDEIHDRRIHPDTDRTDILSALMAARDENGEPLSDQELRDELITLLFAGHETTASAIAWGLYWIHRQPQVKAQLLQELAALGPDPDPMTIVALPYLTAVCQETLRRSPVAMLTFPRLAQEPVEILGQRFEPGTLIMGCMYLTHQRQDLYPHPEAFRPERFLERKYSPYEFIPFGSGVRRCIGEALAQYEMKLVLATILTDYQLELADQRPETPRRRGVTLAPARGVRMVMRGACPVSPPAPEAEKATAV